VLLDAQAVSELDVTAAEQVVALAAELKERGITFAIANANRPLRHKLAKYRVVDAIGQENVYKSVNNALKAFRSGAAGEGVVASPPESGA
jgi:SulP family sulfate permease